MQIVKTDAINAELKAKGPKLGNGAFPINLKHPKLAFQNKTTKSLMEKLDNSFKEEKKVTYERLKLFSDLNTK